MTEEHSHIWVSNACWCGATRGTASDSYTKELEDMLRRIVKEMDGEEECCLGSDYSLHEDGCLLGEAKALLERPGPACEISDETCWGEVGQPVGHDLWFCESHR